MRYYFNPKFPRRPTVLENAREVRYVPEDAPNLARHGVEVIDPTQPAHVLAEGGDTLGHGEVRSWHTEIWWMPGLQAWIQCFCSGGDFDTAACWKLQRQLRDDRARLQQLVDAAADDDLRRVYREIDNSIVEAARGGDGARLRRALMKARMLPEFHKR